MEAPRRLIIECPHWVARHFLAMRILHAWAKEPPWPARGVPVAVALYLPLVELNNKKSIANFVEKVSKLKQFHLFREIFCSVRFISQFVLIFCLLGIQLPFFVNLIEFHFNNLISTF